MAQNQFQDFLTPSDTLNISKRNTVIIAETVAIGGALVGLNQLWYKDYEKSDFHFKNDNAHWLQLDKAGHAFSAYHMGRFGAELLEWSGGSKKSQLIYGSTLGFAFLTAVEFMDGYSAEWGFSWGMLPQTLPELFCMSAKNCFGRNSELFQSFLSTELLMQEQGRKF